MQGEIICVVIICLPVVILCQASISNRVITSRQLFPTTLTEQGQISGPNRSARRRQMETLQTTKMVHGVTPQNMTPAYEGLAAVLNGKASVTEITNMLKKCTKIRDKAISRIIKVEIVNFEKSHDNFVRGFNTLYRSGIVTKQKYSAIRSALSMCSDETGVHRKHITFMKNIPVPKLFTCKNLLQRINQIDIGELYDVRETLCLGLDEEHQVDEKYWDLLQLLKRMALFYLNVNRQRQGKLNWFGKREGSFTVAIGGDGAPFGKDDQALVGLSVF